VGGADVTLVATWRLPRVLVVDDGEPHAPIDGLPTGTFLRDLDLAGLIGRASAIDGPWAVDVDTIRGLRGDEAAARLVVERLGASAVVSRRVTVVRAAAAFGATGLLGVHAFDSTGLRRTADAGSLPDGVGSLLSPGLVLPHLRLDELELLPRPLVVHGLIVRPSDALACLELADAIVVRRDAARYLGTALRNPLPSLRKPLTTIPIEE
jgi:glycerol-3-phosphate responsive antiterminator